MIRLDNIKKIYGTSDNQTIALQDISLEIENGDFVAIMGTSGSGKSTLLNILGAMDRQTEGTYTFDSVCVSELPGRQWHRFRKDHISFVFQQFSLLARYSVYENVEIPLLARGINHKKRQEIILSALETVGITQQKDKLPIHISGGQQQRCAIARAIVTGGDLLLADEPTGALDKKNGNEIMELFKKVNAGGKTIIMVTHDEHVASFANRIIRLEDGKIVN